MDASLQKFEYKKLKTIGIGGFGKTYAVEETKSGKHFAVKKIRPEVS